MRNVCSEVRKGPDDSVGMPLRSSSFFIPQYLNIIVPQCIYYLCSSKIIYEHL